MPKDSHFRRQPIAPEALPQFTSGSLPGLCVLPWRWDGGVKILRDARRANLGNAHEFCLFPASSLPLRQRHHFRSSVGSLVTLDRRANSLTSGFLLGEGSDHPIKVSLFFPRVSQVAMVTQRARPRVQGSWPGLRVPRFPLSRLRPHRGKAERVQLGSPTIVQVGGQLRLHPWLRHLCPASSSSEARPLPPGQQLI